MKQLRKTFMEKKKNNKNFNRFLLLWSGELVSAIGGGLTSFGLGVYIFQQTGSAADMAFVTLLAFLPTLLLSVPAGVLADRYDRRLLMMLGDGCSALGILYILLCMQRGGASLAEICMGVTVSSVFSSLLEPSYRATVTDLLDEEEYSRASGMVSLAGSARYLVSPILAGALLVVADIRLLLVIDVCTFVLTVICTGVVRNGLAVKQAGEKEPFFTAFRIGWQAVTEKRGVSILIIVSSVMTCFMGAFQILAEPLILDFADSATLGVADAGISAKAVDIQKYVENTYGQTIREVRMAAVVALIVAVLVMLVVVVLFTRLLVAKDRKDISLRKAIGFSSEKVRGIYLARFAPVAGGGMVNNGVFCKTHIA